MRLRWWRERPGPRPTFAEAMAEQQQQVSEALWSVIFADLLESLRREPPPQLQWGSWFGHDGHILFDNDGQPYPSRYWDGQIIR